MLTDAGLDVESYLDAWGHPYRLDSRTSANFADRVSRWTEQVYGGQPEIRTSVTPVTRRFIVFVLRSSGPDGQPETWDDFEMLSIPILLKEESAVAAKERAPSPAAGLQGSGGIAGHVLDITGGGIPRARVLLTTSKGGAYFVVCDPGGAFSFPALPAGTYSLQAVVQGFLPGWIKAIPVESGRITPLDITIQLGDSGASVTVGATVYPLQTSAAARSVSSYSSEAPVSTPRLRTYFPETLYRVPELTTDAKGAATAQFPLADSITTWKVAAIASTLDGRQVETEADLRVFQPFFLDFDPPPVLTQGDEVNIPVAVRNYLDRALEVDLALLPNDWSTPKTRTKLQLTIPSGKTDTQSFGITAKASRRKAAQRVVAQGGELSDAIERTTDVHPDGQAVTQTVGDLVAGPTAFRVTIPAAAIAGATTSELRLYPNILTLLSEGATALLVTPHGCAEQTTSAGFANLIALRFARKAGIAKPEFEKEALKNIRLAVDKLVSFRVDGGGISYWGNGGADAAVTAYVLEFLLAAKQDVPADEEHIEELADWLESTQSPSGRWEKGLSGTAESSRQLLLTTAHVARSLALAQRAGIELKPSTLAGTFHHLARYTDSIDEPYALAQFIVAVLDSGNEALLGKAVQRLSALARPENTGLYWDLQSNSPFYGWGLAGRAETTGLVISALSAWRSSHPQSPNIDNTIRRGLLFLLRHRDSLGSWYSTQSTVRVMRALSDAFEVLGPLARPGGSIGIQVDGRIVHTVTMPADLNFTDPILVDMSPFLRAGQNQVELVPVGGSGSGLLRMTTTHWMPWTRTKARTSPELRLGVAYDRLEARVGQSIRCTVKAERVGFRGYGMMLAEIGLPPGAEVDRESLEELLAQDGTGLQGYDVLPDRIILYLWPAAGGATLTFRLSGRLAMTAKSATSTLYDYYNPEALSEVEPLLFRVH
ncbi:MAG: alpha-2-macroglobulin family protein [Paludibaculum sp.]